ncbi:hypothetical protein Droror1_Dr00003716 [Drosera rotundifolia]
MQSHTIPPFPLLLFLLLLVSFLLSTHQQPPLDPSEQESVYIALEMINSVVPWRVLFPDDLCLSAPHGIVCDYFPDDHDDHISGGSTHVVELSFGFVSDYSPNPPCLENSTFPSSAAALPRLRKLFFYRCFTGMAVQFPEFGSGSLGFTSLEELVLIENPALVGKINGTVLGGLSRLRRLVLSGTNLTGTIPDEIGQLSNLEHLVISNSPLDGLVPSSVGQLSKLRVLDMNHIGLTGPVPESIGHLGMLIKLDLSWNRLVGEIPDTIKKLKTLELLDLGHNQFGNFGIPVFLGEMPLLKEIHLSGNNELGGQIPEIWDNLGGLIGLGFSSIGLVGEIPTSMGLFLRNLSYIALDNNTLVGTLPKELELISTLHEMNLQNNKLSGKVPFSAEFVHGIGTKLRLEGNTELCLDKGLLVHDKKKHVLGPVWLRSFRLCNGSEKDNSALMNKGSCLGGFWGLRVMLWGSFGLLVQLLVL